MCSVFHFSERKESVSQPIRWKDFEVCYLKDGEEKYLEIGWECDVEQEHVPHQLQDKDHAPQIEEIDVEDHQKNEVDCE